ncbi:MFS transporter [Corynebacterium striatum]|uniref:MFS transporter n=1 Tax=Corynebacterium striatum TaxID=43770 RepID=A0A2Z2J4S0_CORST|nr:MFS transporter [Corynebacterium striatum]ART21591.1 MFS transporter [Corynebacterium striatum]
MVFYLLVTIMALYAVQQFGASDTAGGFASSSFVVGATIARLFSGYLVDAAGRKKSLLVSLVLVTVVCAAYFVAYSLALLIVVRIIHGLSYAVASTAVMAVAQSVIPDHRRAEGTGYFALGTTLATAFGQAAGLAIVGASGYNTIFVVVLSLTVCALALAPALKIPTQERPNVTFSLANIVHPEVAPFGFFIAYAIVSLAMRFVLGRVQDRHGDNVIFYGALASIMIGLVVLAIAVADWEVVIAGALVGLGYGSIMPAAQAVAVRLVAPHEMGAGISTLFLLLDIGIGFGPVVLGMLISALGYSAMYWVLAATVALATVLYYFVHGRRAYGETVHVTAVTA